MLNNVTYSPGDSILISDIGPEGANRTDAGSSLICVTTNVNTDCCRSSDNVNNNTNGGAVGEWIFPNDSMVPRNTNTTYSFIRRGFTEHVRLTRPTENPAGPLGVYRCEVPSGVNGSNISSNITLVSSKLTHVFYYIVCLCNIYTKYKT